MSTQTQNTATLDVFGDTLEVIWDGNVWVAPVNGQQYSHRNEAMRAELTAHLSACGEDTDSESVKEQIADLLDNIAE